MHWDTSCLSVMTRLCLQWLVDLPLMVPEYRKKTLSNGEILNATSAFMV